MEEWKDIPNFKGLYQVSSKGRVKSLKKIVNAKNGSKALRKEKILKEKTDKDGYLSVVLTKNKKRFYFRTHRLVLLSFVGRSEKQVDHINADKKDNRLLNLRYCTLRENNSWRCQGLNKTSKYTGVSWSKKEKKWRAQIQVNKKAYHLGFFEIEKEAYATYRNFVKELNEEL